MLAARAGERATAPSLLALTRQNLVPVPHSGERRATSAPRGAYELAPAEGGAAKVTIFATGSEVEIALAARRRCWPSAALPTRVVSVPCFELFAAQPAAVARSRRSATRR